MSPGRIIFYIEVFSPSLHPASWNENGALEYPFQEKGEFHSNLN